MPQDPCEGLSFSTCLLALACAFALCSPPPAFSQASPDPSPEALYLAGDYREALALLQARAGLVALAPETEGTQGAERAAVFVDIARCHYAVGDTARGHQVLRYVFNLAPRAREGTFGSPDEHLAAVQAYLDELEMARRRAHYAATSTLKAAGRSLLLPGWGQLYRGHRQRGFLLMGATVAFGAFAAISVKDYNAARDAYLATSRSELQVRDDGSGVLSNPFDTRFADARSKARRADIAVAALAGLWSYAVLENVVVGPNRFLVRIPIH